MTNYQRPALCWGNDFTLNIELERFMAEEIESFDLTTCKFIEVYLFCGSHGTKIPLKWTITGENNNTLSCFVDYRVTHPNQAYGVCVEGDYEDGKHFRWYMQPREGILIINNSSGQNIPDEEQIVDLKGRVGFSIPSQDLSDYYTKEKTNDLLDDKQDTLVSGTNIKTINNQSILGEGNIEIEIPEQVQSDWNETNSTNPAYIQNKPDLSTYVTDSELQTELSNYVQTEDLSTYVTDGELQTELENYVDNTELTQQLSTKQDTLVSGTNIKTINNQSILGEGNIQIEGGSGSSATELWNDDNIYNPAWLAPEYVPESFQGNIMNGLDNILYSDNFNGNLLVGITNTYHLNSEGSILGGKNNTLGDPNNNLSLNSSLVLGQQHTLITSINNSAILGWSNNINRLENSVVLGSSNTINHSVTNNTDCAIVMGWKNNVTGLHSGFVSGEQNKIYAAPLPQGSYGQGSSIFGLNNTLYTNEGSKPVLIVGRDNYLGDSTLWGTSPQWVGDKAIIGRSLRLTTDTYFNSFNTVIGQYNKYIDETGEWPQRYNDALFLIGGGKSESTRKNVLVVDDSGDLFIQKRRGTNDKYWKDDNMISVQAELANIHTLAESTIKQFNEINKTVDEVVNDILPNQVNEKIDELNNELSSKDKVTAEAFNHINQRVEALEEGGGTMPTNYVESFNGQTGVVTYTAPVTSVNGQTGAVNISIPTNTSDLTNDSGFLTSAPVTSVNGMTGDVTIQTGGTQEQADWAQTDTTAVDYIKNKPSRLKLKITAFVNDENNAVYLSDFNVYDISDNLVWRYRSHTLDAGKNLNIVINYIKNNVTPGVSYHFHIDGAETSNFPSVEFVSGGFKIPYPATYVGMQLKAGSLLRITTSHDMGSLGYIFDDEIVSITLPSNSTAPVTSVNGQTGAVTLSIPTNTSDLNNDSGFLTSAPVTSVNGATGAVNISIPDTTGMVTSSQTGLKIEVVNALPASPDANTIYIIQ